MKKLLVIISILLFLAIPITYAYAAQIDEAKAAIAKSGASGVAGENEISALPPLDRGMGHLPFKGLPPGKLTPAEIPENMKIRPPAGTAAGFMPTYWDWRKSCYDYSATYPHLKGCCIEGLGADVPPVCGNFVTPVKDQKHCGSCWAFSTTGALESQFLIKFLTPGKNLNLSEQILLSCSNAGSTTYSCDGGLPGSGLPGTSGPSQYGCCGGWTTTAAQYLHDYGTGLESCYPYKGRDVYQGASCSMACVNWHFLPYELQSSGSDYGIASYPSYQTLKSLIVEYGPVSVVFDVYADWAYAYKKGVYYYQDPFEYKGKWYYNEQVGVHAVVAVGFQDDGISPGGGYFIVKNSWGSGWGMSGYFNIAYSEVAGMSQFGRGGGGNPAVFYFGAEPVTLRITSPDKGKEVCHSGNTCNLIFDAPPFNNYTFAVYSKVGSGKWIKFDQWDGPGGHFTEGITAPTVTKKTAAYFQVIQYYPEDTTTVAAKVTSPVFYIEP